MKVVVLSPHRDDAALALGLSIDTWLARGHRVTVLNCFTQSEHAPFSDAASLHPNDRLSFVSAVRRREDIAWRKLTRDRVEFQDLDLLDAPIRLACSISEVEEIAVRTGDRAVARIQGALEKAVKRSAVGQTAFVVPLAACAHIDHRVAKQAAVQAFDGTVVPVAFYEDLGCMAPVGDADRLLALVQDSGTGLEMCFAGPPQGEVQDAVARKTKIAECYDSQLDSEQVHACAAFAGRESLWCNAAWLDTDLCGAQERSS